MSENTKTIDVVIPAYKPGDALRRLLWMLKKQNHPVRRFIIMITESEKAVYPDFDSFGNVEIHTLKPSEYDHGNTRNLGASFSDADYLLFMTQDAEPINNHLTENLLEAFSDPLVACAYARQLPREDCRLIEKYTRSFNYPSESFVKSADDLERLGIKTFFCSNVCAMYDRKRFTELGGFTKKTIFNEDMIYASGVIEHGLRIAYRADAEVVHSHNFTCMQQFRRNFDLAVSQADHPEIFEKVPSEKEGMKLVRETASYLLEENEWQWIPYLFWQSAMKYLGYRLGKNYKKLPKKFVVFCSMNKHYWEE